MRMADGVSKAPLHSVGKGANRTPPDCVASDLPQAGVTGPSAAPLASFPHHGARRKRGRPAARVVERQDVKKGRDVIIISTAEPVRRGFLFVHPISCKA
jgi:hypothetical protein